MNMGVHRFLPEIIDEKTKAPKVEAERQWFKTNQAGKFGFSLNLGSRELFIGVALFNVELETVVRRKKKKVTVTNTSKVVDI